MLIPILKVARDWSAPDGLGVGAPASHFAQRCAQRGLTSVHGDLLKWAVECAVARGRDDLVERVFVIDDRSAAYRVLVPEGAFYPILRRNGDAVTIYNQSQIAQVRRDRKHLKKVNGNRVRPAPERAGWA